MSYFYGQGIRCPHPTLECLDVLISLLPSIAIVGFLRTEWEKSIHLAPSECVKWTKAHVRALTWDVYGNVMDFLMHDLGDLWHSGIVLCHLRIHHKIKDVFALLDIHADIVLHQPSHFWLINFFIIYLSWDIEDVQNSSENAWKYLAPKLSLSGRHFVNSQIPYHSCPMPFLPGLLLWLFLIKSVAQVGF